MTISLLLTVSQNTSYWQTISSPIITANFLQSFNMGAWGHWLITGMHSSHFQYTVNDTILCFVYHAPSFTNQKFLKKVNFPKIQDFHRGLRLVRRFQSFWVVKKLVKRTSAITLSILWMMTKVEYLIQRFQNPTGTILYNFEATWEIQISINRQILKWVIKAIILCGKQCIALRGHREDMHNSSNDCGIFLLF